MHERLANTLEKISENEKADAPQDRVQLFFSTHDVTLTGWRLREFLRLLRDGKIAAVKPATPAAPICAAICLTSLRFESRKRNWREAFAMKKD